MLKKHFGQALFALAAFCTIPGASLHAQTSTPNSMGTPEATSAKNGSNVDAKERIDAKEIIQKAVGAIAEPSSITKEDAQAKADAFEAAKKELQDLAMKAENNRALEQPHEKGQQMEPLPVGVTALPGLIAQAAARSTTTDFEPPAVLRALLNHKNDVVMKVFPVSPGLVAYIVAPEGDKNKPQVVYVTQDGHALVGALLQLDPKNGLINKSKQYMEENTPKVEVEKFMPEIENSAWIEDGASGPDVKVTMYAFFDANCIYCHYSYLILEPYFKSGLQIRWIPVAILGPTSMTKAAALLQSENVREKMRFGHENWEKSPGKSFEEAAEIPQETIKKVEGNMALMKNLGVSGTPAFVFRDPSTGSARIVPGLIPASRVSEVTGLPAIENNDPRVEKFK